MAEEPTAAEANQHRERARAARALRESWAGSLESPQPDVARDSGCDGGAMGRLQLSERQTRGQLASMAEVIMRCVVDLEKLEGAGEVCAKLRMAVLRYT